MKRKQYYSGDINTEKITQNLFLVHLMTPSKPQIM